MKSMDNKKAMKTMEQQSLQKYLEKLAEAEMHKITLFHIFEQTGAPNLSAASHFVLIDDLASLADLNSGRYLN